MFGDPDLDIKTVCDGVFADAAAFAEKVHVLWLGVGTDEPERMLEGIRGLHAALTGAGIEHIYRGGLWVGAQLPEDLLALRERAGSQR